MKKWEEPRIQALNVCHTMAKAINLVCNSEVNIEGNGKIKCMDWTKGNQKHDDICIYAVSKKTGAPIYTMNPIPNNGNAYCSNYQFANDPTHPEVS